MSKRFSLNKPVIYFLGHMFLVAWTQLLYSSSVLLLPPGPQLSLAITHLFSSIFAGCLGLAVALLAYKVTPLQQRREMLHLMGIIGAVATCGIPFVSCGLIDSWWVVVCVSLAAAAGTWLSVAWFERFAAQGVRGAFICYALTSLLGSLLCLLISLCPQPAGIVCTVLLPFCATFSLQVFRSPVSDQPESSAVNAAPTAERFSYRQLLARTPMRLILVAGIISFSLGAIRTLQLPVDPAMPPVGEWAFSLVTYTVALAIAGIFAFLSYRLNQTIAFYIAIPLIALAAILLATSTAGPGLANSSLIYIGTSLITIMVWLLLVDTVAIRGVPAAWCFGMLSAIQFAGTFIGQVFIVLAGDNRLLLAMVVLVVLLLAALAVIGERRVVSELSGQSRIEARASRLCDSANLSPREREVFMIWASGHNSAYIEQSLNISKNTVKTHLAHIYSKTKTTNREELLVLLDEIEL
ncbi:MAG: helix-turn-helix transcriptional regulator [Coriobacteriales bacterium]|nr:helix-turn-helix transcriptional regulator [Coriobacteriales bacterium]